MRKLSVEKKLWKVVGFTIIAWTAKRKRGRVVNLSKHTDQKGRGK
jgi:hypothetical protein